MGTPSVLPHANKFLRGGPHIAVKQENKLIHVSSPEKLLKGVEVLEERMLGKDETIALLWLHHLTCTPNMLVTSDYGSKGRLIVAKRLSIKIALGFVTVLAL